MRVALTFPVLSSLALTAARGEIPLMAAGHGINQSVLPLSLNHVTLGSLSTSSFAILSNPAHPAHQVRIKRIEDFCDPTVRTYVGYLDADHGTKHLFFYFFESRNNPEEDDVMMWINGGPGGSSATGLFTELGPCNIDTSRTSGSNGTVYNPYGWNSHANIFFLDQPAGTGFSYDDLGRTVSSTQEAAKDVYAFLSIFFHTFVSFRGRPFHMSGESYGGRYIPLFASEIWDQNLRASAAGLAPINLKSVLIGDGLSDAITMVISYYDAQCTRASLPPTTEISTCVRMKRVAQKCKKDMKAACVDSFDEIACTAIFSFCANELTLPYISQGRNPYDMSKLCLGNFDACYEEEGYIEDFLNRKDIQSILGIDEGHGNFSATSSEVNLAFLNNLDHLHQTQLWIRELLERDIDVLIYVGTYDFVCNWIGNLAWAEALEWSGKEQFNRQDLQPWIVDGKQAGRYKTSQRFTFATVEGAGHLVPFDKPAEALAMVQRWMAKRQL